MFTQLLAPIINRIHPCGIEEVRHSIQKERRIIDTLEPVMNQHKLIFDRKVVEQDLSSHVGKDVGSSHFKYQLFYQMTRITKDRGSLLKDDRLDALAIAVAYFSEDMDANIDGLLQARDEEEFMKSLQEFEDMVGVGESRQYQDNYLSSMLR